MTFIEAGVEYSKDWAEGKFKEKNNKEILVKKLSEAAGTKIEAQVLKTTDKSGKEITLDNFYLILIDYVTL